MDTKIANIIKQSDLILCIYRNTGKMGIHKWLTD